MFANPQTSIRRRYPADRHPRVAKHLRTKPAVKSWLHNRGFVLADFNGQRNLLDVMRDDAFQRDLHQAMGCSAQSDRPKYESLLKGLATMGGVKWTSQHDQLAQQASGHIAEIAPYLQAAAPDVWDQMHGSTGSVSSLTHAIAEANRHNYTSVDSHAQAQQIFDQLYNQGDHMATRGFSARDMGEMYKHLARRGAIGTGASASDVAKRLQNHAGPISAIRDSLNFQRNDPASMDEIFNAYDAIPSESRGLPHQDLETQLRAGDLLNREGGAFSAATRANGPLPPGLDLQTLEQQDRMLRQQGAASPMGNLEGARARMRAEGLDPDADPGMFRDVLNQYGANTKATRMSPELMDTVRRSQMQNDLQPRITSMTNSMLSKNPKLQSMSRDQAAMDMGYSGAPEMDALHGPVAEGVPGVMHYHCCSLL